MKKNFILLITLLFIPLFVFADAAVPVIFGYDAVITNKNGAKVKDSKEVIPYNTRIHIYDEEGKYGVACLATDEDCGFQTDNTKTILMSDYKPAKDIKPSDLKKSDEEDAPKDSNQEFIVFEKNGLKLSKGPANAYGKYDKVIKYMTHLKATKVLYSGGGEGDSINEWYYIDDGEYQGWLNGAPDYSEYIVANKFLELVVFKDAKIYDKNNNVVMTIKEETILDNVYYIAKNKEFYVKYDNKDGYIKQSDFVYAYKHDDVLLTLVDTNIISNGKVVKSLPLGTKIDTFYANDEVIGRDEFMTIGQVKDGVKYYYVQYDGVKGFVKDSEAETFWLDTYKEEKEGFEIVTITLDSDYEMEYNFEKLNVVIPQGTSLTSVYHYEETSYDKSGNPKSITYYLVNYNNTKGYIVFEKDNAIENDDPGTDVIIYDNDNNDNNSNKINIIIICSVIGAICLFALTVIILVIIFVKRSKKTEA